MIFIIGFILGVVVTMAVIGLFNPPKGYKLIWFKKNG